MKSIIFIPVKDYLKSRKKLPLKFITPLFVSIISLVGALTFDIGDADQVMSVFSEFIGVQINIVAILVSFSVAIITILVSADNQNIQQLRRATSDHKKYKSINGKALSLFQVLLSNIAYNVVVEVVYLVFLIGIVVIKVLLPIDILKYIVVLCIFVMLHILLVLLESVAQMYLTFWENKTL